jgi:hypothetical protein
MAIDFFFFFSCELSSLHTINNNAGTFHWLGSEPRPDARIAQLHTSKQIQAQPTNFLSVRNAKGVEPLANNELQTDIVTPIAITQGRSTVQRLHTKSLLKTVVIIELQKITMRASIKKHKQ